MRVLVLWASESATNLGLQALAAGTRELVRRCWPDAEVVYYNYGSSTAPVRVGTHRAAIKERITGSGGLVPWLRGFDLVVDTRSGDSFADIYGNNRLFVMTMMGDAVRRAGVPMVLGPQTIGPFESRRGRVMARWTMRSANLVMARDSLSARAAQRLGRPVDVTATDVVFALPATALPQQRDILFNVSGLLWQDGPHVDSAAYRALVVELIRSLLDAGREVALFAHVLDSPSSDNDVAVLEDVRRMVGRSLESVVPVDLEGARAAVGSCSLVIGSRMHACLNSLSMGTPAVSLAYSRKFEPLLADLGWRHTIDLRQGDDVARGVVDIVTGTDLHEGVAGVRECAGQRMAQAQALLAGLHN